MRRKRLTLLVSAVCALALLTITVVPVVASPPQPPKAQFAAVLEQLTEEGVISSEQAGVIMERTAPVFGRVGVLWHACRHGVKDLAVARVKPILMKISQALDMEPDELVSQLKEGRTVAQIAGDQGVPLSELVDELLEPIEKGLDQAVADDKLSPEQAEQKLSEVEAKITEMLQEASLEDLVRHEVGKIKKQGTMGMRTRALLHQVSQIVDLDHEELLARLKEGEKIVDIAQEQGVDRDELLEALIDRARERLDKAVVEGKLDEGKAGEIMPKIEEKLAWFIDNFPSEK